VSGEALEESAYALENFRLAGNKRRVSFRCPSQSSGDARAYGQGYVFSDNSCDAAHQKNAYQQHENRDETG
jgi:hypothetical protein